jgi:hypothetical protein
MQILRSIPRLAALLVAAFICLPASALDIKGVAVGKPLDCERIRSEGGARGGPCVDDGVSATMMIWGTTLLGTRTDIMVRVDPSSHAVLDALIKDINFDDMRTALTKKFGQPQCTDTAMTNGMGAHFAANQCVWEDASSVMVMSRNMHKLGDSQLTLLGRKAIEESARAREKASSDL